jgi:hypothetical protein
MKLRFLQFLDNGVTFAGYRRLHLMGSRRGAARSDNAALLAPHLQHVEGTTGRRQADDNNAFLNPARRVGA